MNGKKALLYCPIFYGYEKHIVRALKKKGFSVKLITPRISRLKDFILSFYPEEKRKKIYQNYLDRQIQKYGEDLDLFFVIKGNYLTPSHLNYLKSLNPKMKTLMYQWDSMANHDYSDLIDWFDGIATFDKNDSVQRNLSYIPLFYTNDIIKSEVQEDIDFLMVGVFHPERYKYFLRLKELASKNNLNFKYYIFCPPSYYLKEQVLRKKLHIQSIYDIRLTSLSRENLINLYQRSKVFVDVCRSGQSGMSMRTVEAYGMNKKLLTDNLKNISEDKYMSDMDMISCDSSEREIIDFLQKPTKGYLNSGKLSIDSWCESLLDLVYNN